MNPICDEANITDDFSFPWEVKYHLKRALEPCTIMTIFISGLMLRITMELLHLHGQ
jgi:hypothetical protein